MLISRALDRLTNAERAGTIDWLDLTWQQCARRAIRASTRSGRNLRIIQQLGHWLKHEDVLWYSDDREACIVLNLLPAAVIVGEPADASSLAKLTYELGNLHVPIEISGREIIAPADGPIESAYDRAGVAFQVQTRRFQPTCRSLIDITVAADLQVIRR